jgi:hypothetical protein
MKICKTIILTFVICAIWSLLEYVIYGEIEDRIVDNIMMVLFIPVIYRAAGAEIYTENARSKDSEDKMKKSDLC